MNIKKILFIVVGVISLGVGCVGAVIPLLPSFPFLLLACFCFAKSSEKLHSWFLSTKIYKNNLESYVEGKGMSKSSKIKIITTVTIVMSFSLFMMRNAPIYAKIILLIVWIAHILYFIYGIKNNEEQNK